MPNRARRRVDDPPEIDMAPVREENRDVWARAQTIYERFKLAWAYWIGFAILFTWAMIHIIEPLEAVPILQAQVSKQDLSTRANFDTVKARLDTAETDRKDITQVLKVFGKFICLQMNAEDRYKYDINCGDLPKPSAKPKGGL
jgi:hypothetical protein